MESTQWPVLKHDLVVIGGGPAGLTAAMKAGSERIGTMVLDSGGSVGGQAAMSSCIENYAGFPEGISGPDLMARIVKHALRFNTEFMGPERATSLTATEDGIQISTDEGDDYLGKVALLTTGVEFKHLKARNMAAYIGEGGVHYGPAPSTADFSHKTVVVIGGANSAGQAAHNFSSFNACKVYLVIRGESIEDKMSGYLIDKIAKRKNIEVLTSTEITGVDGNGHLDKVILQTKDEEPRIMPANELFVFIGSIPKTLWLPPEAQRDNKGFVVAGSDLPPDARQKFMEKTKGRPPYGHETSIPGLFVAGDVRCGTPKGVSVASGDGAGAIAEIHTFRHL